MRIVQRVAYTTVITAGIAVTAAQGLAQAQPKFPTKPVRIVAPTSAGSQTDTLARMIGSKMSESWGQPVVVENRPGGGTTIGANVVAKAAPDGYTLLLAPAAFVTNAALQPNLPYDPLRDFAGVTQIGFSIPVLIVAPALGVKSVKDLIGLSQAKPGKILFGSAGAGGTAHLNGERFRLAAGIKVVHVGFKGQPEALIEVLAGRVHYAVLALGVVQPFIKDGRLLALAVFLPQRSPVMPEVPAIVEVLPRVDKGESVAILAPAKTPRPILDQISKEVARILALPDVTGRLHAIGFVPAPSTPEEQDKIRRAQIEALSRVVRGAGLRTQ